MVKDEIRDVAIAACAAPEDLRVVDTVYALSVAGYRLHALIEHAWLVRPRARNRAAPPATLRTRFWVGRVRPLRMTSDQVLTTCAAARFARWA